MDFKALRNPLTWPWSGSSDQASPPPGMVDVDGLHRWSEHDAQNGANGVVVLPPPHAVHAASARTSEGFVASAWRLQPPPRGGLLHSWAASLCAALRLPNTPAFLQARAAPPATPSSALPVLCASAQPK